MKTYSTEKFHISNEFREMVVEASELVEPGTLLFDRIYDDACDSGFALRSHRGGVETVWVKKSVDIDNGELVGWTLVPTTETLRKNPQLEGWTIVVYND